MPDANAEGRWDQCDSNCRTVIARYARGRWGSSRRLARHPGAWPRGPARSASSELVVEIPPIWLAAFDQGDRACESTAWPWARARQPPPIWQC